MPTLNMDLEIAEQAVRRMETAHATITDQVHKIRAQVYDSLQDSGNWMGFSANDFYQVFNTADITFDLTLEKFRLLGTFLHKEVDQWKAMQEHLIGHAPSEGIK